MPISGAVSGVDCFDLQPVELGGQPHDFGSLGDVRLTVVTVDGTGGTVIAMARHPDLIAPFPVGEFGWSFATGTGRPKIENYRFQERRLQDLLLAQAHIVAREAGIPTPNDHPARPTSTAGMITPCLQLGRETLDLSDGSRLRLVVVTHDRTGAAVLALRTTPDAPAPETVGYLTWALSGERRVQTAVRDKGQEGAGIGRAMWEFACRSSELVDWIAHPQHSARRSDDGEAFVRRMGGTTCCRCGQTVDAPAWIAIHPAGLNVRTVVVGVTTSSKVTGSHVGAWARMVAPEADQNEIYTGCHR